MGKKTALVILDGWGHGSDEKSNAIYCANTPFVDSLYAKYPNTELLTHGEFVGLPKGQMGNSEVGHMHIGAGRLIEQDLTKINKVINDKQLDQIEILSNCFAQLKNTNATLHLIGLCSNGGVHSHISHLEALIDSAIRSGVKNILIHAILDGRDTKQKSAIEELPRLEEFLAKRPEANRPQAKRLGTKRLRAKRPKAKRVKAKRPKAKSQFFYRLFSFTRFEHFC